MKFKRIFLQIKLIVFLTLSLGFQKYYSQINSTRSQVVLQGFWWDYWNSNFPNGWANYLTELAPRLKQMGIDAVWIPPTIKSQTQNGVGYSPFDHYDLGDKYQKTFLKTRVGDKDELLRMVAVLKANGIDIIQDLVLNHVTGAGTANGSGGADPSAMDDGSTQKFKNFRYSCYETPASPDNAANYLARKGRFSKNWQNFYPNNSNVCCTNEMNTPYWGPDVSYESNAFGLSGNATYNPNQSTSYMRNGFRDWLIWYKKQVGWDGVRIDAIKHFPAEIAEDYLWNLQNNAGFASGTDEMFAVGEWVGGAGELDAWANAVQNRAGTFDFSLRNGLVNIIQGNGNFNIGSIPSYQQQNRLRTVPFVNNHDTYRPILDADGNYIGWNTGSQLGSQIEPNDPRASVVTAISLSVDGAPEVFFEDLFNIGYNSNRFSHKPNLESELPVFSDIANIIWCHQNLHFKEGSYMVPWQAQDALVIERSGRALIAVTDSWANWQNLTGVQTTFADGTVLYDYSGANGTGTRTVYGGGKVDISIPPCDGTALMGRRGYSIWAPQGITENYDKPAKQTVQEWEMANDLGDNHLGSLQQGGQLPDNSLDCRVVGKIFPEAGKQFKIEIFPETPTKSVTLILLDKNCNPLDSVSGIGNLVLNYTPSSSDWHTLRIRNTANNYTGQKCWVKANYFAPKVVNTSVPKAKCNCVPTVPPPPPLGIDEQEKFNIKIAPNPVTSILYIETQVPFIGDNNWSILDLNGKTVLKGQAKFGVQNLELNVADLQSGIYILELVQNQVLVKQRFVKD
jgi:alpha-amylase